MRNQKLSNGFKGLLRGCLCGVMVTTFMLGGLTFNGHAASHVGFSGVVKEVGQDYLIVKTKEGLIHLRINKDTVRADENGKDAMDFKVSDRVKVKAESQMTRSLPPQTNAVKIKLITEKDAGKANNKKIDKKTSKNSTKQKDLKAANKQKNQKTKKNKNSRVKINELNDLTKLNKAFVPSKSQLSISFY